MSSTRQSIRTFVTNWFSNCAYRDRWILSVAAIAIVCSISAFRLSAWSEHRVASRIARIIAAWNLAASPNVKNVSDFSFSFSFPFFFAQAEFHPGFSAFLGDNFQSTLQSAGRFWREGRTIGSTERSGSDGRAQQGKSSRVGGTKRASDNGPSIVRRALHLL